MNNFTLINLEWNCYNGVVFELFYIDTHKPLIVDSSMFGIEVSPDFFYIDILWISVKIFDKTKD